MKPKRHPQDTNGNVELQEKKEDIPEPTIKQDAVAV
jgi:hypothetical protein